MAQHLQRVIHVKTELGEHLGDVLDNISRNDSLNFAYNNNNIPYNRSLPSMDYRGTLLSFLENTLGPEYVFVENANYVILRHAPKRFSIKAEAEIDKDRNVMIRGIVEEMGGPGPVRGASVFDKNLMVSTLTDRDGNFSLRLKDLNQAVRLTASKDQYRDTMLVLLPAMQITMQDTRDNYRYFPDKGNGKEVERSPFARMFIGYKRLIQSVNIGNFFAQQPFQFSITPGLSSQGMYNGQVIDNFSLNLLGGYTAGIEGVEIGGLFNINRQNVRGTQLAGIVNLVGGNVDAVQLAGVINKVEGNIRGVQLAGVINTARNAEAVMLAGVLNSTKNLCGIQVAGASNIAQDIRGIQVSGLFNIARDGNIQITGLMNIARKSNGLQLGLVNIAEESDYTIGLLNFVKHGEWSVTYGLDRAYFHALELRTGGRKLYSVYSLAYQSRKEQLRGMFGLGLYQAQKKYYSLATELHAGYLWTQNEKDLNLASLRLNLLVNLTRHIGLGISPTLDAYFMDKGQQLNVQTEHIHSWETRKSAIELGWGAQANLRYSFSSTRGRR